MKKTILLALVLVLTACSLPIVPTPIVVTATPFASVTTFPTATPAPTQTLAPSATVTETATPTLTPTPSSPIFTVNIDSNCRSGPSKDYPVIEGIFNGESVPILGQTTPERALWWYVTKDGTNCWVSSILGTTSGNILGIPYIAAPPIPTPTHTKVKVLFENNTGRNICRLDFYVGIDLVDRFKWAKNEFKGDGGDQYIYLAIGGYDLIEAYDCNGNLTSTLTNVVINQDNDSFALP